MSVVTTFARAPLTAAVLAGLTAAGMRVGDGEKPVGAGWAGAPGASSFLAYVVVHPLGGGVDGSLDHPSEDVWPIWQVTSFGASREQCEVIADRVMRTMLALNVSVAERTVGKFRVDLLGGTVRFDDPPPPIWQNADRFTVYTTPTTEV